MSTLGNMKARGEGVTLFCRPTEWPPCHHATTPSIDQLIQYFGVDFDIVANRQQFLSRFVCQKCHRRYATMTVGHAPDVVGVITGVGSHDHGPLLTLEEATRRHHDFHAERRRLGIKTSAEINAQARERLKAEKRAERAGEGFIGPPSPWAHRKKGRWI